VNALWGEVRGAVPLIFHGDPALMSIIWFTLQVAAIATVGATVIGLPIGLTIGLGRFRGRRLLQLLANASLGLPPVLVGLVLLLMFAPHGPFASFRLETSRNAVFIAQTILALPYVVALTAAAVQGLPGGLLSQARALGAGPVQLGMLALREARIGVVAGVLAALGTTLSEVGAVVVVGGNAYGYDQTLASSDLFYANAARYEEAVAVAIVLIGLILIVMCGMGVLQQRSKGVQLRFRTAA
jgi:tungstate transport system permease protein